MFSYRHIYHAGNYADVFKHVVLLALIQALQRKDTGFCVQDTHAGIGLYDLHSQQARKNREFDMGVELIRQSTDQPDLIKDYLGIVQACNEGKALDYYPGSPMIARKLVRPQDQMVLTELNETDYALLKRGFRGDAQVAVHHQDAWTGLKAFLPPRLKRGLVLIDPPYELKSEVPDMVKALTAAHKKWPTGMYAIWYPIFEDNFDKRIARQLKESGIRKILDCHMTIRDASDGRRMIGTGMFIINPPWQLEEQLQPVLEYLWNTLSQAQIGSVGIDWIVPE